MCIIPAFGEQDPVEYGEFKEGGRMEGKKGEIWYVFERSKNNYCLKKIKVNIRKQRNSIKYVYTNEFYRNIEWSGNYLEYQ